MINELKKYQKKHKITQFELARRLNVHEGQLNRWLKGHHRISAGWKRIISQFLEAEKPDKKKIDWGY